MSCLPVVRVGARPSFRRPAFVFLGAAALYLLLPNANLEAQDGTLTGTVTDASSLQPVSDARVYIPGELFLALTDGEGRYSLEGLPAGVVEIRVERLGYAAGTGTFTIPAGGTATADFSLEVSAVALDGLVVTATGLQRRRELGNAAASIEVDDALRRSAPQNLTALLQGRAAGVQVLQSSGTVGSASTIKIRGNGSISLNNTPLIYVDGSRVSNSIAGGPGVGGQSTSRLNDLSLEDILSVEIVRGPSAATLYGAEAAAGVIRITTRRGQAGAPEWTVRSGWGASWDNTDWPETVWNPRSFYEATYDVSELFIPGELPEGVYFAAIPDTLYSINLLGDGIAEDGKYGTPWETGIEQVYGATLRGGSEGLSYFLSGELSEQDGTLSNNRSTQRNLRANFDIVPSERLSLSISTGYGNSLIQMPDNDNSTYGYVGVGLLSFPWEAPIRREDLVNGGEFTTCPNAYEIHRALVDAGLASDLDTLTEDYCAENPFFGERTFDDIGTLSNSEKVERLTTSVTADYQPFEFLTARGTLGYDHFSDQTGFLVPVNSERPFGEDSRGLRSIAHGISRLLTLEGNVNATFDLTPSLRSTTSVGYQFFRQKFEDAGATGRILPFGSSTASAGVQTDGFESVGETRTLGLYVQEQLEFWDRLFVTPALRFDDSSAFGENLGRQTYPRVMASYVLSEEEWFDGSFLGQYLGSLRVRGAWGQSGKQPAAFAALKRLAPRRTTFKGEDVPGLSLAAPGNPELMPERGQEIEVGFETELVDGRVGVDFTWYHETTKDAIVPQPLAPSSGYNASFFTNIGEMTNQGIELGLTAVALNRPGIRWDWTVNAATTKGEVTSVGERLIFGLGGDSQRHQEGYPFGSYFSRTYAIGSSGQVVASDSAVFVGQPTPTLEGSIGTSVALFGWLTLDANLGFALGHEQFNSTSQFRCGFLGGGTYGGVCPELFEVGPNGELTDRARILAAASEDEQYAPWIEDADFARLRSISARFELPTTWMTRVGARSGSFSITGENLALFTGYSGIDPEVNFAGGTQDIRAEFFTLPPSKRVVGRLSIAF